MTRQNVSLGRIGPIRIGGGFKGKVPFRNYEYPPDRLIEFLRLDISRIDHVYEFCNNYQLIVFSTNEKNFISTIKKEQKYLKELSRKLFNKELLNIKEVELINSRLSTIKQVVAYPARENFGIQNTPPSIKGQLIYSYLSVQKSYGDSFASLWEDLITHFVSKQDMRQCINCGDFFLRLNKQNRLCCNDKCKNQLHQKRNRARKKLKK